MKITLQQAFATLGVAHGASEDEARSAYRKLALQYHPDKNPHAEATAKFQEISASYKKICDFHKRRSASGNQGFFDEFDDCDDDYEEDDGGDYGFGGVDLDDFDLSFDEMLMMFEMMFGPTLPSGMGGAKKKKKSVKTASASTKAPSSSSSASVTASAVKVPVPLGGKARRRKAPLGKHRGRGGFGGMDDQFAGLMDPEMMMFEQFVGMSMNDPEMKGMEEEFMDEMMHMFAHATGDDLFDFGDGKKARSRAKQSASARKAAAATGEDNDDEDVEEVSDWEDEEVEAKQQKTEAKASSPEAAGVSAGGNQDEDKASAAAVKLDSRVRVYGKLLGTVKFVGPVHYCKGDFIGVELDEPEGKNDGTLKGTVYFKAKAHHGLMVRPEDVTLARESQTTQ